MGSALERDVHGRRSARDDDLLAVLLEPLVPGPEGVGAVGYVGDRVVAFGVGHGVVGRRHRDDVAATGN